MSTNRTFSRHEDGSNGTQRVNISLICTHDRLRVVVVFECHIFMLDCEGGREAMYYRIVKLRISQVGIDTANLVRALESVFIRCDSSD
eukprot:4103118-Pleurochrysis_carterae.AAC.1